MLKIGIIGCGNVLEAYVPQCEKARQRGLAELRVACGRPHQAGRARAMGVPNFVLDERRVLENGEVDLVVVLASMPEHGRLARAALNAGKHVLLEKPLAADLSDAREILRLARERKREIFCAPFTVLSPTFQAIARRIEQGAIGRPCLARARYGWSGPWWSEWFYKPGGGCIFDLGVYCLTTLTGLLGPARRVFAMTGISVKEREVNGKKIRVEAEDNAQISLEFDGGAFATVMTGFTMQQYRTPAVEVYGTAGTIQMLGDDWDPDGYELWQNPAGCWQVFKETDPNWPWADGLRHAIDCLTLGEKPLCTPEHAYHVLEIMLLARASGQTGRALPVESIFIPPKFAAAGVAEEAHLMHDRTREHVNA